MVIIILFHKTDHGFSGGLLMGRHKSN